MGPAGSAEDDPWDFERIRAWATDRADDWCLADGSDRLTIDGLAPNRPLRVEMFSLFFSLALGRAGETSDLDRRGPSAWLRRHGADRAVRAWSMRLQRPRPRAVGQADLAVVSEMATPSALIGPAAVLAASSESRHLALVADPRALRFWARRGTAVRPLILDIRRERRLLSHATESFRSLWARFEADPPQIKLGTRDLTSEAMQRIQRLVPRSLPWLHVERAAIREALADGPKAILLASDQHRIGSMVAAEAFAAGIPSAVLQHGLPQHRVGYVPLIADRMLAWSEESKAWFVAHGTDPDRIVVVGNPAFDQYSGVDRRGTRDRPLPTNVLLALTPATKDLNAHVVTRALEALAAIDGAILTVKLHPGDGDWQYVRRIVQEHPAGPRVTIRHREPLVPLLQQSTVTWLHRSSVAIESLAAGVPVVVVAAESPSTADLELQRLALPVARSSEDLARTTAALAHSAARATYFETRDIVGFVGPESAANCAAETLRMLAASQTPS